MSAIIVASRVPTDAPLKSEYSVRDAVCNGPFDYWSALETLWGSDLTIVNVEHDVEFSDLLVAELLSCPWPMCAYPYRVLPAGWPGFLYSAAFRDWVSADVAFASFTAIGFCKITPESRAGTTLERKSWDHLETAVHNSVANERRFWHLHWPEITHEHDYSNDKPEDGGMAAIIEKARAEGRLFVHGPDPATEDLKNCDPFLHNESLRRSVTVLPSSRPDS